MNTIEAVRSLIRYGLDTELIEESDIFYVTNALLDTMKLDVDASFHPESGEAHPLEEILKALLDDAADRGVIENGIASRDLFDTRLMNCLTHSMLFIRNPLKKLRIISISSVVILTISAVIASQRIVNGLHLQNMVI